MNTIYRVRAGGYAVWRWSGVLAIATFVGTMCGADDSTNTENSNARRIDDSARWAIQLGETCRSYIQASGEFTSKPATQPSDLAEMGRQIRETQGPDLGNALIYYRAVQAWLASDDRTFADEVQKASRAGVFQPDLLLYKVFVIGEGDGSRTARRIEAWNEYGRIVPISQYGQDRADRLAPAGLIDPPLPAVPKLAGLEDRLVKIGDLYANSGLCEQAVDAYIESVFALPLESWKTKGATLLTVGKIETQLGQAQLAIEAYLKAGYCDSGLYGEVRNGIADVFKTRESKGKEHTDKKLSAEVAIKIAELYRQCNLHPFALRVLSGVEIGENTELSKQRQAIEKEWLLIVDKHQRVRGDICMLLGVKVSDVKSWADADILRPSDTFWKPREIAAKQGSNGAPNR